MANIPAAKLAALNLCGIVHPYTTFYCVCYFKERCQPKITPVCCLFTPYKMCYVSKKLAQ